MTKGKHGCGTQRRAKPNPESGLGRVVETRRLHTPTAKRKSQVQPGPLLMEREFQPGGEMDVEFVEGETELSRPTPDLAEPRECFVTGCRRRESPARGGPRTPTPGNGKIRQCDPCLGLALFNSFGKEPALQLLSQASRACQQCGSVCRNARMTHL